MGIEVELAQYLGAQQAMTGGEGYSVLGQLDSPVDSNKSLPGLHRAAQCRDANHAA